MLTTTAFVIKVKGNGNDAFYGTDTEVLTIDTDAVYSNSTNCGASAAQWKGTCPPYDDSSVSNTFGLLRDTFFGRTFDNFTLTIS